MNKRLAGVVMVTALTAGCQPVGKADEPSWQSPKPGISYYECTAPADRPCLVHEDDGRWTLHAEGQKPREVEYLWKEDDGRVRVRWIQ